MTDTGRKMLFFDIDGTLITNDEEKRFPESAKWAIQKAREAGHLVFINSGRVLINIEESIREVGFDGLVCGCGTYILSEGKELLHHKIPKERCLEIAKKARACSMQAIFEHTELTAVDSMVEAKSNREILDYFRAMGKRLLEDIEDPEFVFDKFTTWYESDNPYVEEFKQYLEQEFTCIKREGNFIEVVPKGFSKATGIEFLQNYYKIPLENVYVFGDSNNDLDMIRYAKNSIAMGVCTPEVLEAASYHTETVEADGVYLAMKHFHIIGDNYEG